MPVLKPLFDQNQARELLAEVLPPSPPQNSALEKRGRAREAFDNSGLSVERVASKMSTMLDYAEEENTKLKIMDMALKVHGAMDEEKSNTKQVSININFANTFTGDVNALTQILIPRS